MFNTFDGPLAPDQFFSIVVMSYTRPKHLKQLLESLHEHADMPFEVIVHDDASGLALEAEIYNECRTMCSTLVFSSPSAINMGLAAACNRAIALANSKYVLMMNDDCKMLRPCLQRMKKVLDRPYIGSFGPWQTCRKVVPGSVNPAGQMAPVSVDGVDFNLSTLPNGAGMFAFRKDAWESVRGFPQVYTNAGDTGFMIRLLMNGYFNASTFINEEEFFTNVDQLDGYKDPTAGKSPFDSSYPHIWGYPDFIQQNEYRRVRIYDYSHHHYYAEEGVVNHTWWHEKFFVKAYKPAEHNFDWDFMKKYGQDKWRDEVEKDLAAWRAKYVPGEDSMPFEEVFLSLGKKIDQDIVSFQTLYERIEALRPTKILELGYRNGGTARMWQNMLPADGLVVSVDMAPNDEEHQAELADSPRVHLVVGNSHDLEVIARVKELGPYDAIFIDGDHSYEGVKADYYDYTPMVRSGGIVSFHDYGHGPILQFINELNHPGMILLKGSLDIGMFVKE